MIYPVLVIDDLRSFDFDDPNCPYTDPSSVTYVRNWDDANKKIFDYKNVHIQDLWLDFDLGGNLTCDQIVQTVVACAIHDIGSITVDRILIVTQNPDGQRILTGLAREICDQVVPHISPVANGLISAPVPEEEPVVFGYGDDGSIRTGFINELGNYIEMKVRITSEDSIRVFAQGPTSETVHFWTPMEAEVLSNLLTKVLEQRREGETMGTEFTPETEETEETSSAAKEASEETTTEE